MNPNEWLYPYQWVNITPPFTAGSNSRNRETLIKVIAQFDVETAQRYAPTKSETWCNIFVSDVSRALACEIPHWWSGHEMTANAMGRWLASADGLRNGWRPLKSGAEAAVMASKGFPAVASFINKEGVGHIAIVLPGDGSQVEIAQAGRKNFNKGPITAGFGTRVLQFYVHN